MSLADFIRANHDPIIAEWVGFARTLTAAKDVTQLQLRDHVVEILNFISQDIERPQTANQQVRKSHGESDSQPEKKDSAAETHGTLRHDEGFDIVQMVSEYRALRSSVIKLWTISKRELTATDVRDLTRFNEAIDQALAESVVRFMEKVEYSKDLLLGVLGHDIRSPLGAITMMTTLLPIVGPLNEKQTELASQMTESSARATSIVTDLLDLAKARMGSALPVSKAPMNMTALATHIIEELQIQNPGHQIHLTSTGDTTGKWDKARLGQLFSNLISNALQYGDPQAAIEVSVAEKNQQVVILVQNKGEPVPPAHLAAIFKSFTRGQPKGGHETTTSNLGLGLFITKEIVTVHGGSITVASTQEDGTTFTITLPKHSA